MSGNKTTWLVGIGISGLLIAVFLWMWQASRAVPAKSISNSLLDKEKLNQGLPVLNQRQKNGDLPIKLIPDNLKRENPFGQLE